MSDPLKVIDLPMSQIEIGERIRPVTEAKLAALAHVIEEYGFTVPILVRKVRAGYHLIDGAHRIEIMTRRGAVSLPCCVSTCTAAEARAQEATQNLVGGGMSPLDDALFLAAYSKSYEELHPETRRGAASALARQGIQTELSSFCDVIAESRAITSRQARKIVAAGRLISRSEADLLRASPKKITLKDVETIGKIGDSSERGQVVLRLSEGNAKSAAEARRTLRIEAGVEAPVKDPVEAEFQALSAAWRRASMAVRRRFFHEFSDDIAVMEGGTE